MVGRSMALLFHNHGTRRGWVVSTTTRPHFIPGKNTVLILHEAGWSPGPIWAGGISRPNRDSIPDRPARSQSLYRLSYRTYNLYITKPILILFSYLCLDLTGGFFYLIFPNYIFVHLSPVSSAFCCLIIRDLIGLLLCRFDQAQHMSGGFPLQFLYPPHTPFLPRPAIFLNIIFSNTIKYPFLAARDQVYNHKSTLRHNLCQWK